MSPPDDGRTASNARIFNAGDRVCADARPGFPQGTVVQVLDNDYVLVRWDGDVLETADRRQLRKVLAACRT